LRGRVGRSHHRAYAYLLIPERAALTPDAVKRLEAFESLAELGSGFMLSTHDLEIRGAGELLGEDQSGQIQEVGFTLYNELLERAIEAIRKGEMPDPEQPIDHGPEVDLRTAALLPEDYMPDVQMRLIFYKRIATARTEQELDEMQVEMIDRFGLLPTPSKHLFLATSLRLKALRLGIRKIEAGHPRGRILFDDAPQINAEALIQLLQTQPQRYRMDGRHTLRLLDLPAEVERRAQMLAELLDRLHPPQTAHADAPPKIAHS
jgi:transcription-repair coupling factor (superfamily II helicase)